MCFFVTRKSNDFLPMESVHDKLLGRELSEELLKVEICLLQVIVSDPSPDCESLFRGMRVKRSSLKHTSSNMSPKAAFK